MNPLDYASLEASKRLADAGIVLETEKSWYDLEGKIQEHSWLRTEEIIIPRPSMAEVWRELPNQTYITKGAFTGRCAIVHNEHIESNDNPTDALIDLLIWVRKKTP